MEKSSSTILSFYESMVMDDVPLTQNEMDDVIHNIYLIMKWMRFPLADRYLKPLIRHVIIRASNCTYIRPMEIEPCHSPMACDHDTLLNFMHPMQDRMPENIMIKTPSNLICHYYDLHLCDNMTVKQHDQLSQRIDYLKGLPQPAQRTPAWYAQRESCLTATAIGGLLDEDPHSHPIHILLDKCGKGKPFQDNINTHHGKKYEQIGTMFYEFRYHVEVGEYGLIAHDQNTFIAASPDGICEAQVDGIKTSLAGRLLEIKFPRLRTILTKGKVIGDICPRQYWIQIQTQLYVTGMKQCDFLQCKAEEYEDWQAFVKDSKPRFFGLSKTTNLEKGCILEMIDRNTCKSGKADIHYDAIYIYPPKLHMTMEETQAWIASHSVNYDRERILNRVIFWRLNFVSCHTIDFDEAWYARQIPKIEQFWHYIQFYKSHVDIFQDFYEWVSHIPDANTAEIFTRVHEDYVKLNANTSYQPLFQSKNEWRLKFEENERRWRERRAH